MTEKEAYKRGMIRAIWMYAVWIDGKQVVGDHSRSFQDAVLKADEAVANYWPEDSKEAQG